MALRDYSLNYVEIDIGTVASGAAADVDSGSFILPFGVTVTKAYLTVRANLTVRAGSYAILTLQESGGTNIGTAIKITATASGGTGNLVAPVWTDVTSIIQPTTAISLSQDTSYYTKVTKQGNGQAIVGLRLQLHFEPDAVS